ncbi:hypothetical protein [Arthrobacter methylotrophus]
MSTTAPTPEVMHGAGWTPSVTLSESLPKKWLGGAGWVIPPDTSGPAANSVYSMKTTIGVLSYSSANTDAAFTTYDKNGVVIAKSPAPVELSSNGLAAPYIAVASSGGKSYLIVVQSGTFVPDPTSTKSAGKGAVLTSFDVATGKLVTHAVIDNNQPINSTGNQALFTYGQSGDQSMDTATHNIFNPETGKTDTVTDAKWLGRFDGVDVTAPKKDFYNNYGPIVGQGWTVETAAIGDTDGGLPSAGKYLNLRILEPNGNTNTCETIDVHTGKPISIEPQLNKLCMYPVGANLAPYFGVLEYENGYGANVTFANPETGKVVQIDASDTFKAGFIGADGIVYGMSSAVQGTSTPAYLDLNDGTPKTLGDTTTLGPIAVSGDGTAVFQTAEGLAFINPVGQ